MSSITIRLDPKLQEILDCAARREGLSRSEFVRECIQHDKAINIHSGWQRFSKWGASDRS